MEYAQGLARAIASDEFNPGVLDDMGDDTAIGAITQIRGFARWSAEVYMMFYLQREDIFPADDLILLTSLQNLKNYLIGRRLKLPVTLFSTGYLGAALEACFYGIIITNLSKPFKPYSC
jgi:3-methyladenine DNA glycosylase/8-oxoguanine DNA glycosylase